METHTDTVSSQYLREIPSIKTPKLYLVEYILSI